MTMHLLNIGILSSCSADDKKTERGGVVEVRSPRESLVAARPAGR
jgi:hypothetical protein